MALLSAGGTPSWASHLAGISVLAIVFAAGVGAQQMDEYRVKAAFLYNFAKFVDWPADALLGQGARFAICVIGQDPFGSSLEEVVAGKSIGGRSLQVRRLSETKEIGGCQILFVSSSETKKMLAGLAAAKQKGVLTVGEAGNSTSEGVVIKFTQEGGKVRFEINMVAAEDEKLRLSSKLLSLATVVRK